MTPTQSLTDLPAPPILSPLGRVVWAECRWSAVALLGVNLLKGFTPAAQVALTARLLTVVLGPAHGPGPGTFAAALPAALGLIAVTLLRATLTHLDIPLQQRLSFDLQAALDGRTLAVAARSPLALFDRDDWYDLVQAAGTSAGQAAEKVLEQVAWLLASATTVATVGVLLAAAAWWLPVGLLAGLLPTALWELWQGDRRRRQTLRQAPDQRLLTYLSDLLAGGAGEGEAAEVRLFGLGGHLLRRWRGLFGRLGAEQAGFEAAQAAVGAPAQVLRLAFFLGGLVVLGLSVLHGHITPGSFMALAGGLGSFNGEAGNVAAELRRIRVRRNALADFGRLALAARARPGPGPRPTAGDPGFETPTPRADPASPRASRIASPPTPQGAGSRLPPFPRPLRHGIVFDGVSFSYPGASRPALRELNLTLAAGRSLALVGPNGAGKSTLVKLLLGLYAPDSGRILADGRDLATLDPDARRAAFAPVFQDHLRLQFTLAEAIGFGALPAFLAGGDTAAGRTRIQGAAQAAGAALFVADLPLGYDTPLGRALDEHGTDLSGGQWQRLAIARALYARPEVLVLDEPAAALDPQAEVELYAQFSGLAADGRTTLLVTHRLGAARIADRIAVLDDGRVAEEGTHADLVAAGGLYAALWAAQAGWYR